MQSVFTKCDLLSTLGVRYTRNCHHHSSGNTAHVFVHSSQRSYFTGLININSFPPVTSFGSPMPGSVSTANRTSKGLAIRNANGLFYTVVKT